MPAVRAAAARVRIDTALGDAGCDSECNHATCRRKLGIRAAVIALNWRGSRKWSRFKHRCQVVKRFRKRKPGNRSKRVYDQRVQSESAFSRATRRLGASVASINWPNQHAEILLKVFAHNVPLLAARVST